MIDQPPCWIQKHQLRACKKAELLNETRQGQSQLSNDSGFTLVSSISGELVRSDYQIRIDDSARSRATASSSSLR